MPRRPKDEYSRYSRPRDRSLRVGDAEREAVAEILRREHVNGRLDVAEFQERLDRALRATTYADLDVLVADLPGADLSGTAPSRRREWTARPWPMPLLPLLVIAAILATHGHVLWLAFPLFAIFVVRPLVWHSLSGRPRGYGRW